MAWNTFRFLLSRRGSLEFKRLHNKGVLYTPGLSHFPRSFKVFNALLTDPVVLQKRLEPEEFLEGTKLAYPLVTRLMIGSEESNTAVREGEDLAIFNRRAANVDLAEIVAPNIYEATRVAMDEATARGQSWEVKRIDVLKSWLYDIWTGSDAETDSEDVSQFCRVAVQFVIDEAFLVTDPLSQEPILSERIQPHIWVFESRTVDPGTKRIEYISSGTEEGLSFEVTLPRPFGMTIEEGDAGRGLRVSLVKPGGAADQTAVGRADGEPTIMAGDHIVAVDDVDVSELPFDDCIDLLAPAEDADDEDRVLLSFWRPPPAQAEGEEEGYGEGDMAWSDWKVIQLEYTGRTE
jgi:hypothetical protein